MRLLYKPIGIIVGLIAGFISTKIFDAIWSAIDDEEAPKPMTRDAHIGKIMTAALIEGMTMRGTRAVVERAGAKGWDSLFGVWPGELEPEKNPDE